MYSCVYVLIPNQGSIDGHVALALAPFDEDLTVKPYKRHFSVAEIRAMIRHYKLARLDLRVLVSHLEDWCGEIGGIDERGLFAVSTVNPNGHWDWYEIGGRWDGRFPDNVLPVRSLLERSDLPSLLPEALVTPGGRWLEQETYVSEGWLEGRVESKSDRAWLTEVRETLNEFPDHRLVCVDVHN